MPVRRIALVVIATLLMGLPGARAEEAPEMGGRLQANVNGQAVTLPLMHSDFSVSIEGDLANVTLVQTFENPTSQPINATYLFPLHEDAAVHAMTMEVGNEVITAHIRERDAARQEYEAAREEGRAAALLTEHRPNMFTQEVANLMPGAPVRVTLHYAEPVPRVDGAYELVLPLVVGPRYNPAPRSAPGDAEARPSASGQWAIAPPPAYPREVFSLTLPNTIPPERVSIAVDLKSALPIANVVSATHALAVSGEPLHRLIHLQAGRVVDNRDFVLRYTLAGAAVATGVLTHADERGGFFSLVVEPPRSPNPDQIAAREIVFVLDTSGSMSGEPVEASKAFMREALRTLRPGDYFRIVQFNSTPREFSEGPVPATPQHLADAQRFVAGLTAGGGTEVVPAIEQAFRVRPQPNTLRLVVFLSDGYIGNEAEVLAQMGSLMGDARVYAFGVGSSVNRYLLSEMARRGRGLARYIDPTETSFEAATALAHRLDAPVLTDISIDWGNLHPTETTPRIIPDLFAGDALRIMGRFTGAGQADVIIHGKVDGRPATLPVHVTLGPSEAVSTSAIPIIWARSQVRDLMRDFTSAADLRSAHLDDAEIQQRVTRLGLDFALVTNWTSFVAVSQTVVNSNPGPSRDANVPLPMPEGVGPNAYGELAEATFGGASAPEPGALALLALLVMLMLAGVAASRRKLARAKL